ncbi:ATP-dependent RNA helicase DHX57, putative [Plasmodium ovale]|uniref:ATP-dependent RNA helicase DHX57, putative n=1 Tax=Plasmodium ovale TaxID=36330 RepID=A0A1D3THC4_PLAOA|nr:ATP-dependent RNA helicase DHX57, putative [Plasmodium ovale]
MTMRGNEIIYLKNTMLEGTSSKARGLYDKMEEEERKNMRSKDSNIYGRGGEFHHHHSEQSHHCRNEQPHHRRNEQPHHRRNEQPHHRRVGEFYRRPGEESHHRRGYAYEHFRKKVNSKRNSYRSGPGWMEKENNIGGNHEKKIIYGGSSGISEVPYVREIVAYGENGGVHHSNHRGYNNPCERDSAQFSSTFMGNQVQPLKRNSIDTVKMNGVYVSKNVINNFPPSIDSTRCSKQGMEFEERGNQKGMIYLNDMGKNWTCFHENGKQDDSFGLRDKKWGTSMRRDVDTSVRTDEGGNVEEVNCKMDKGRYINGARSNEIRGPTNYDYWYNDKRDEVHTERQGGHPINYALYREDREENLFDGLCSKGSGNGGADLCISYARTSAKGNNLHEEVNQRSQGDSRSSRHVERGKTLLTEDNKRDVHSNTEKLSIYKLREKILNMIEKNDITFIQGETGSGKSTCVPKFLLEESLKEGKKISIIVTEPRRIACISLSRILSEITNETLGDRIAYRISGESLYNSKRTLITYTTIGYLFKLLLHHKHIYKKFTHVIIDEIHDRSILLDIVLLFVKLYLHNKKKEESVFKLIIMSATMQGDLYYSYFKHENIKMDTIFVGTKIYHVDTLYIEDVISYSRGEGNVSYENEIEEQNANEKVIDFILRKKRQQNLYLSSDSHALLSKIKNEYGRTIRMFLNRSPVSQDKDISVDDVMPANAFSNVSNLCLELVRSLCFAGESVLIFLPGMQDINDLYHQLSMIINNQSKNGNRENYQIHMLHSCLHDHSIYDRKEDNVNIKIFLSSNIAESSITIPNVRLVIDFCTHKNMEYDPQKKAYILVKKWTNKSSMEQRKGRCGRTCHGICIRMISKDFLFLLRDHKMSEVYTHCLHLLYLYVLKSMPVLRRLVGRSYERCGERSDGEGSDGKGFDHVRSRGVSKPSLRVRDVLGMIIEKPSQENVKRTRRELMQMKAVIRRRNKLIISIIGQMMIRFSMGINLCRLLLYGILLDLTFDVIIIVSILNTNDIFPSFNLFSFKNIYTYGVSLQLSLKQKSYFDGKTYSELIMLRNIFLEWLCLFSLYIHKLKKENKFKENDLKRYYMSTCSVMQTRNYIHVKKLLYVINNVENISRKVMKILHRDSNAYRSAQYMLNLLRGRASYDTRNVIHGNVSTIPDVNKQNVFQIVSRYSYFDPSNENIYMKFLFCLSFTPLFIQGTPKLAVHKFKEGKPKGRKIVSLLDYIHREKLNINNCVYFRGVKRYDLDLVQKGMYIMCPYLLQRVYFHKDIYIVHFESYGVAAHLDGKYEISNRLITPLQIGNNTPSSVMHMEELKETINKIKVELLRMYDRNVEQYVLRTLHSNIGSLVEPVQAIVPVPINTNDKINNAPLSTNIINFFANGKYIFLLPLLDKMNITSSRPFPRENRVQDVSIYFQKKYEFKKPMHPFLVQWVLLNTDNYKMRKDAKGVTSLPDFNEVTALPDVAEERNSDSESSTVSEKKKRKKVKCKLNFRSVLGFLSMCPFHYNREKMIYSNQSANAFAVCAGIEYSSTKDTLTWVNYATIIPNKFFLTFFLSSLPYHDNVIFRTKTNLLGCDILSINIFDSKEMYFTNENKEDYKNRSSEDDREASSPIINKHDLVRINFVRRYLSRILLSHTLAYNKLEEERELDEKSAVNDLYDAHGANDLNDVNDVDDVDDVDDVNDGQESDAEEVHLLKESPYLKKIIHNMINENNKEEINYSSYNVDSHFDEKNMFDMNLSWDSEHIFNLNEKWDNGKGEMLINSYDMLYTIQSREQKDPYYSQKFVKEKLVQTIEAVKPNYLKNNLSLHVFNSINAYAHSDEEDFLFFKPINLASIRDTNIQVRDLYYQQCISHHLKDLQKMSPTREISERKVDAYFCPPKGGI